MVNSSRELVIHHHHSLHYHNINRRAWRSNHIIYLFNIHHFNYEVYYTIKKYKTFDRSCVYNIMIYYSFLRAFCFGGQNVRRVAEYTYIVL